MNRNFLTLLIGSVIAMAGCGGGGSSDNGSLGSNTCKGFFSEAKLCQFECGIGTGTEASKVASTLGLPSLGIGHGCAEEVGGGGAFSCLMACTDDPTGNQMNVTFHFDSASHLASVDLPYAKPQCLIAAGCR